MRYVGSVVKVFMVMEYDDSAHCQPPESIHDTIKFETKFGFQLSSLEAN